LLDIASKKNKKTGAERLNGLITRAQQTENYGELISLIKQIEHEFIGQREYTNQEKEIKNLRAKLAQKNLQEYRQNILEMIGEELKNNKTKIEELELSTQQELNKLRNGEITNPAEIDKIKKLVSENSLQISLDKKLENLIERVKNCNYQGREELIEDLIVFITSKNSFYQNSYQKRADEISEILNIEKNSSPQQPSSNKNNFPVIPVIIATLLISVVIGLTLVIQRKKSQRK